MKAMVGLSAMFWLLPVAAGFVSAGAHDVATRCRSDGCSTIVCNHTGDRCRRYDEDRRDWSDRRRDEDRDGYQDSGYWRYREGRWRSNCDPDNTTCVVRGHHLDDRYDE